MERSVFQELYQWKESKERKPLILYGARQTGKTWIMQNFAKQAYTNHVYINFEDDILLKNVFEKDFDIERIIETISIARSVEITKDTLLIFDEVQEAPRGVTALKYFYEKRPDIPVIVAGSLLGIAMHQGDSFPVGKVQTIKIYPLSFSEFICALGEVRLDQLLKRQDWNIIDGFMPKLLELLKLYYYVGGMPEAVQHYIDTKNLQGVRRIQDQILSDYDNDFSKHAPISEVPRIRMVWKSILSQLAKENKKFIYSNLRQGARAKDYEIAIEWLCNAGLVHKVTRVKGCGIPLMAFEDLPAFKLYISDIGLLGAMGRLTPQTVIDGNVMFGTAKGAYTEQFALQQLLTSNSACDIHYWSAENSSGELDFIIQHNDTVIPIEIKSSENVQSKSLRYFVMSNSGLHGVRFSTKKHIVQDWVTNYPLFSVGYLF